MQNCLDAAVDAPAIDTRALLPERALPPARQSIGEAFRHLIHNPVPMLVHQWNWKSAVFSSLCRGAVFFFANLSSGMEAATGAMLAEFVYRSVTAGFYGALTQCFRRAEPRAAATTIVMIGVPLVSHAIEFMVHWLRHTPNLRTSILASLIFTFLSTSFNLHAMRRGVLVVGSDGKSLGSDMRSLPAVTLSFLGSGFGFLSQAAYSSGGEQSPRG